MGAVACALKPGPIATQPALIRSGEVLRRSGWSRAYLRKLVTCGVLKQVRHARGLHPWYLAKEVDALCR